ncbi:hypothetical protein I302_100807 [Kwoniella bestiolae CBS 10118]|uniref:Uncharacterized protein n=1 Tax=Kwoniella bestiolae CBS 10118 TaxID=1296100 RepID=A0A1B9G628_9TREE|nr:hypothetical protein I302_04180 [Kwoniella bestiolae CBS 10118]OCF26494.1 hypothetical protein I302_04180 [Kwoniella bestiolae CBS 10118]
MTSNDNPNKILLLHHMAINPSSFLTRVTGTETNDTEDSVRWTIDNKYYTADVDIHCVPLSKTVEEGWKAVDVVLYLFERIPTSLPPTLIKLLSTPRDIALAIRTLPSDASSQEDSIAENGNVTELVDMLDEVGMEFIDEVNPLTEEDDERPLPPLEIIRQTLMTHHWPHMTRKPLNLSSTSELPGPSEISRPIPSSSSSSSSTSPRLPTPHVFPETFQSSSSPLPPVGPSGSSFPELEDIRREIAKADFGFDFVEIDKLDRLNDDFAFDDDEDDHGAGPSQEEYARLDDWLDDDEDIQQIKDGNDGGSTQDGVITTKQDDLASVLSSLSKEDERILHPEKSEEREGDWLDTDDRKFDPILSDLLSRSISTAPSEIHQTNGFADDFDEFTEFQSAPAPGRGDDLENMTLALDPTPLLLHLQSVRAELAGVTDEDERRVRAGKEVQQILASLGMGDLGEDDMGLDDI